MEDAGDAGGTDVGVPAIPTIPGVLIVECVGAGVAEAPAPWFEEASLSEVAPSARTAAQLKEAAPAHHNRPANPRAPHCVVILSRTRPMSPSSSFS
jgi:hypothetical protein